MAVTITIAIGVFRVPTHLRKPPQPFAVIYETF